MFMYYTVVLFTFWSFCLLNYHFSTSNKGHKLRPENTVLKRNKSETKERLKHPCLLHTDVNLKQDF